MPNFESETAHIAHALVINPKSVTYDYHAELYLGKTVGDKAKSSDKVYFSIPAGGSRSVDFTVSMPRLTVPSDTFHVYLEVSHAVGRPVSVEEWSESHERRIAIAASYGIEYRPPTFYNPATGESMPEAAFFRNSGTWQTEVDWINEQISKMGEVLITFIGADVTVFVTPAVEVTQITWD